MTRSHRARIPAPFGTVGVATDDAGRVRCVDLAPNEQPEHVPASFPGKIHDAFEAYLAGETDRPTVPVADVDVTAFQRQVLEALPRVDPGDPVTYGELAARIGKPGAARAVGQALRSNPLPLVWPCHRVVAADGLGGFGGASEASDDAKLAMKRWLLEHERRGDR